jgi:hypothetical protein
MFILGAGYVKGVGMQSTLASILFPLDNCGLLSHVNPQADSCPPRQLNLITRTLSSHLFGFAAGRCRIDYEAHRTKEGRRAGLVAQDFEPQYT